jgi:cobalt transporter subunit CbtB
MQQTQTGYLPTATPAFTTKASVFAQAILAAALGLFVVGVVGFSDISAIHNAAHDVRHSNAFPCH